MSTINKENPSNGQEASQRDYSTREKVQGEVNRWSPRIRSPWDVTRVLGSGVALFTMVACEQISSPREESPKPRIEIVGDINPESFFQERREEATTILRGILSTQIVENYLDKGLDITFLSKPLIGRSRNDLSQITFEARRGFGGYEAREGIIGDGQPGSSLPFSYSLAPSGELDVLLLDVLPANNNNRKWGVIPEVGIFIERGTPRYEYGSNRGVVEVSPVMIPSSRLTEFAFTLFNLSDAPQQSIDDPKILQGTASNSKPYSVFLNNWGQVGMSFRTSPPQ